MKKFNMFKCESCDGVIEVVVPFSGCEKGLPEGLQKLEEKSADATTEKHVPYVEEKADGYLVKVGKEAAHPMTEEHFIQFIEIIVDDNKLYREYLKPNCKPEAFFAVPKGSKVVAREYCNLHGLWEK